MRKDGARSVSICGPDQKDGATGLARTKTCETDSEPATPEREESGLVGLAILDTLASLDDPAGVRGLAGCLRSENAAMRNVAVDTLRRLGDEGATALHALLEDPDPEVRIFAIDILDAVHYRDGERWLIEIVELDLHANVCSAAVELLCEVGTEAAIDPLLRLKARFPHHIFIQFAADLALKRILES